MESEPMLTPRENPLYQKNSPQRRIEPMMLYQAGQQSQHSTNKLFHDAVSSRTAIPTLYQQAIPWCCIKQDSNPNTLPTSYSRPRGRSSPWCCIKQDSNPNTLPTSYSRPSGGSSPWCCIKQDSDPNTLPASYSMMLYQAGQQSQHSTNKLFLKQDSDPNTLPASYSMMLYQAGQRSQHSTNKLFHDAVSSRTAIPTLYQQAIPWCCIKQDSDPNTLPTSYSMMLHQAGQRSQHSTNKLFHDAASSRTAIPTLYQQAIPWCCIKQDSDPNTLPTSYSMMLHQAGQRSQHSTNKLFHDAASSRTAIPTLYQQAIPWCCIKQDSDPNTLPTSYSMMLHQAGQRSQHSTSQLFHDAASSRTAIPTLYQPAIPWCCIKQDSDPNTLPASYSMMLHQAGQRSQHSTSQLFHDAASSRTAIPTLYQPAIPWCCIKQDSDPNTLPASYSTMLHQAGQRSQHSTSQLFHDAASSRTAIPTLYQPAIPWCCIKQDSDPNTLPASYSMMLHQAGQQSQHSTSQLFHDAASSRTAIPTLYQQAIPWCCIKQDSNPNTLPASYSRPLDQPAHSSTTVSSISLITTNHPVHTHNLITTNHPVHTHNLITTNHPVHTHNLITTNHPVHTHNLITTNHPVHTHNLITTNHPVHTHNLITTNHPVHTQNWVNASPPLLVQNCA